MDQPAFLIVDDEPDICWTLAQGLRGFPTATAHSAAEAWGLLASRSFVAAFVDGVLPDESGLSLAAELHERFPHLAVVLISGYYYADDPQVRAGRSRGEIHGFLAKPFDLAQLRELAASLAAGTRQQAVNS